MATSAIPTDRSRAPRQGLIEPLSVVLAAAAAALTVAAATVHYTGSDPSGALLVSDQILERGTIALDAVGRAADRLGWSFLEVDGHLYYFYGLGASFASLPFVLAARLIGVDVRASEDELQVAIAAVLAAASVVLMYSLARRFLPHLTSLVLATVFWFGSSLASTGGTAMWSADWAVVFGLSALLSGVIATQRDCRWCWLPLGVSLLFAYLSRPTMALLALVLLPYVAWRSRRTAALAFATVAVLAVPWVMLSLSTYGSPQPPYYEPGRLTGDSVAALPGMLVSPGRGLLVYLPVILLIPLLALVPRPRGDRHWPLLAAMGAWMTMLILTVSRNPDWYGGWAFGPRLLTEGLPAVFLATVLVWPPAFPSRAAKAVLATWIALSAWGVYVHTVNGLFNPWTAEWNVAPEVNAHPEALWDWRYPPFLHNQQRHVERLKLPEYQSP